MKTHQFIRGDDPNREQVISKLNYKFQANQFPWLVSKIRTTKPFQIIDIDKLPAEADDTKKVLMGYNTKSFHYFPLLIKEKYSFHGI